MRWSSALLLIALLIISLIGAKRFTRRINAMSVQARLEMTLSRQNRMTEDIEHAAKRLERMQHAIVGYLLVLLVLASSAVFFCSAANGTNVNLVHSTLITLLSALSACVYFGILPFFFSRAPRFDGSGYDTAENFPALYAIARSAAEKLGITGEIRIVILHNYYSASIQKIGQVYSLQLGAALLYILHQEELEQILMHEFAHMTNPYIQKQETFSQYEAAFCSHLSLFGAWLTAWPRAVFNFEKQIYSAALSPLAKIYADRTVKEHGDLSAFASAGAKAAMLNLFLAEFDHLVPEPYYQPETPRSDTCTAVCKALASAIESRGDAWMDMLQHVLLPIPIQITLPSESSPYRDDCLRAITRIDKHILEMYSGENEWRYREARTENYLRPLAVIEAWEENSENASHEDLPPVLNAYLTLNRFDDMEALCDAVIQNTKNIRVASYAMYVKGERLLDRYDPEGIELIYRAIEINYRFMDQGLSAIEAFCTRTGLQKELEEYQKRSVELRQKHLDIYSKASEISIHDRLSYEQFPDDRLTEMLAFITKAGMGQIRCVFLIRKTITPDYFTSVFLINFVNETAESEKEKIMEKIANYLDTYPGDLHYSLFSQSEYMEKKLRKKFPQSLVFSLPPKLWDEDGSDAFF